MLSAVGSLLTESVPDCLAILDCGNHGPTDSADFGGFGTRNLRAIERRKELSKTLFNEH